MKNSKLAVFNGAVASSQTPSGNETANNEIPRGEGGPPNIYGLNASQEVGIEKRAIKTQWPTLDELKELAVSRTKQVLEADAESSRNINQAVRNVLAMNSQQMTQEGIGSKQQINVGVGVNVDVEISELSEDERLERLRILAERIRQRRSGIADAGGIQRVGETEPHSNGQH